MRLEAAAGRRRRREKRTRARDQAGRLFALALGGALAGCAPAASDPPAAAAPVDLAAEERASYEAALTMMRAELGAALDAQRSAEEALADARLGISPEGERAGQLERDLEVCLRALGRPQPAGPPAGATAPATHGTPGLLQFAVTARISTRKMEATSAAYNRWAWTLDLTNTTGQHRTIRIDVQWVDSAGYVLETHSESAIELAPYQQRTLRGERGLRSDAPVAGIKVRER